MLDAPDRYIVSWHINCDERFIFQAHFGTKFDSLMVFTHLNSLNLAVVDCVGLGIRTRNEWSETHFIFLISLFVILLCI